MDPPRSLEGLLSALLRLFDVDQTLDEAAMVGEILGMLELDVSDELSGSVLLRISDAVRRFAADAVLTAQAQTSAQELYEVVFNDGRLLPDWDLARDLMVDLVKALATLLPHDATAEDLCKEVLALMAQPPSVVREDVAARRGKLATALRRTLLEGAEEALAELYTEGTLHLPAWETRGVGGGFNGSAVPFRELSAVTASAGMVACTASDADAVYHSGPTQVARCDSSEYALVALALLRASGIPARLRLTCSPVPPSFTSAPAVCVAKAEYALDSIPSGPLRGKFLVHDVSVLPQPGPWTDGDVFLRARAAVLSAPPDRVWVPIVSRPQGTTRVWEGGRAWVRGLDGDVAGSRQDGVLTGELALYPFPGDRAPGAGPAWERIREVAAADANAEADQAVSDEEQVLLRCQRSHLPALGSADTGNGAHGFMACERSRPPRRA